MVQKRDETKRQICKQKGIVLIEISYDEKLSEQLIIKKIQEAGITTNQKTL